MPAFALRFVGQEALPPRLSDFDREQFFTLTSADVASIREQFRSDHRLPPQQPVPEGVTVEHGRYVAQMCTGCHGAGFGGGRIPGSPPDWPAAANLTPGDGGVLARYPDAESFARMMKSGRRGDGSRIAVMPFEALEKMSDTDLHVMHLFLRTLEPRTMGSH